ncbi:TRIM3 [Branchiostoma lanceolatum]|uniref:RING-type E3 ubiquitin transferase n=1 Tax=Branchiostoma lanceolatum TaxID=7740 RepID=A0A8J9YUT6_BRALA|nr:TRIM3 [Branchiostoma lanceolatum]
MATADALEEELVDESLTCSVCKDIYDDPRVLPCLHAFCVTCLEQRRTEDSQLTCPTCQHQWTLKSEDSVSNLPSNFYINKLLNFRALHNSEDARCQMCESGAKVESICGDCKLLLCGNCFTAHSNSPALKDHYIITLHDLKNPSTRAKYTGAEYCTKHNDVRVAFYCQPCAKLVCRECTITEHKQGRKHNPREVSEVAQKYKDDLQTLVQKTVDAADALKNASKTICKELTSITINCQVEKTMIREHFVQLKAKLEKAERDVMDKLEEMEITQREPLVKEKESFEGTLRSIEDGLKFCTDMLGRNNDVEILTLGQHLEDRLKVLAANQVKREPLKNHLTFQHSTDIKCELVLTCKPLVITYPPVESLPTSVVFRPQKGQVQGTPQVTVTSPGGQCVTLDTTKISEGAFEAVWRPQTTGKHVVGVATESDTSGGGRGKWKWGRASGKGGCSPLIVDVSSNNPVLTFGQKGSQQGQFDRPLDVAVRGDRLYVADTFNKRVQVFDLSGKFCFSFLTTSNPESLVVQTDGTILVHCGEEVVIVSPLGELQIKLDLEEQCTAISGLAVQRDGGVVVADSGLNILLVESDGRLVKQVNTQGLLQAQPLSSVSFVCGDNESNIIVSDTLQNCVQVFDVDLNFLNKFGERGRQPHNMWSPTGVSADSRGNIVLANVGDKSDVGGVEHGKKLQVFRPDGTWVATISSDKDKLNKPHGVAVTEDGHVFVVDYADHCVRKYRYM